MRKKIILALIPFLILCTKKRERTKLVVSSITESVYASAIVEAEDQYNVFSKASGILKEVRVKPGESVKPGDVLFVLDNRVALLNIENSRLTLERSKENTLKRSEKIAEQETAVKLGKERYLLDSALYYRQNQLWNQKVGTLLELEHRRLAFINSKSNYQTSLLKLKDIKEQLNDDLSKSRVNYNINRSLAEDYIIRSAVGGTVFNVFYEEGELITPQAAIAVVGRTNRFVLEMNVDENDIAKIRRGQQVELTMNSYKGRVFEARVTDIFPMMDETTRTFKVKGTFIDPPEKLYPNLTAEANIIIQSKKRALIIPRNYLIGNKWVLLAKDRKQEVKTGLMDFQKVEVISGIDSSQYIYKP
ncbi:efflux RND transporter periplasmic adaptor subunit [Pedobacter sp. P351]|uniref:efflux RND transporter periplasmic adaptor subunit n=1 Tax=Pedobacter superstes TaxID=3133441 RepID=UPI0030B0ED3A